VEQMKKTVDDMRLECQRDLDNTYDQRTSANECERFLLTPAAQWDGFERGDADWRPRYQFDIISQHIDRWYGEWLTNRPTVKYRSEGARASKDAELLTNLFRKDESRFGGYFSVNNAVRSACNGGFGAMKLVTRYVDNENDESDEQVICFEPIYSAYATVIFDSGAKRQDKADARRCHELIELTEEQFEEQFPGKTPSSFINIDDMRGYTSSASDTYVIARRYEVKEEKVEVIHFNNFITGDTKKVYADDVDKIIDELKTMGFYEVKRRKMKRRYVECSVLSTEVLEAPKRIAGKYIPIIPFYGYWGYVDGAEWYSGMVRRYMDPQRLVNMAVSNVAEVSAFSPLRVPYFLEEQVKGHENRLAQRHLGKMTYQKINAIEQPDGTIIPSGPVGWDEPPPIPQSTQQLIEMCTTYVQQQTGGTPQDVVDPDASGKAILAMQSRVDMNMQVVNENIQVGQLHLGEVYRCMAKDTYTAEQIVTTMDEMGKETAIKLYEIVYDEGSGDFVEINDIGRERFTVVVDTGPSYRTQRQQTAEEMRDVVQLLNPDDPMRRLVIGTMIDNFEVVGADDLIKYNRKQNVLSGMVEPRDEEEKAMIEQLMAAQGNEGGEPTQMLIMATAQKEAALAQESQSKIELNIANAEKSIAQAALYQSQTVEKMQTVKQAAQPMRRLLMQQPRMMQ
jgi:hypothetical protein